MNKIQIEEVDKDKNINHEWTSNETKVICEMYLNNKTAEEIKGKLPNLKLSSIKMKLSNCIYLDKGNVNGSLSGVSKMHELIWKELHNKKKINIPKIKKQEIWENYIGISIGETKCMCCSLNNINAFNFHNGHIIAKSKGGDMSKENLRPICSQCNLSMGNENMIDFMKRLKYDTSKLKIKEKNKILIKCKIRNNQWGKTENVFETIKYTKKIISPWGHWKNTNKLFEEGKFNNEKFSNIFINDLKINDYICMFDRKYDYALVLKVTSNPIAEKLKEIIILRNNKCHHKPMINDCKNCSDSVELVFSDKYFEENNLIFKKYLNEDYNFENMYAIYRNIEIVGIINDKCEFYKNGKVFQSSICRQSIEIFEDDIIQNKEIEIEY